MPHSVHDSTSTAPKMSRPSTSSNGSEKAASKQVTSARQPPESSGTLQSPSPSHFSFQSSPYSGQEREDDELTQMRPLTGARDGPRRPYSSRSRQRFYDDSFSYKDDAVSSTRERISKDAPIVAELRTNVIIKDEYTLVTDLSHHLSTRYQRPETSIMITVNHSACLLLGGSFEPCYVLTISALPVQLGPTVNKRNAALVQQFMTESIGVTSDRGVLRFVPIHEDSLAMNGMTILGDIERLTRQQADENGINLKRAISKTAKRKSMVFRAKSSQLLTRNDSKINGRSTNSEVRPSDSHGPLDSGVAIDEKGAHGSAPLQSPRPVSSKRSEPLFSKFHNQSDPTNAAPSSPPPIPQDRPRAINKRKSFLAIFRR